MKRISKLILLMLPALAAAACRSGGGSDAGWSGTIEAVEVDVGVEIAGRLTAVHVDEGDRVAAGDPIAAIDVGELEIQKRESVASLEELERTRRLNRENLVQAEENLKMAERDLERIEALWAGKTATRKEYDDIQSRARIAGSAVAAARAGIEAVEARARAVKARLELLESRIARGDIRSPADGYVVEKYLERGEMAAVGAPVVTIADLERVFIRIYVSETDLGKVKLNGAARLRVDSFPGKDFAGRVAWISPEAEFTPKNVQTREARVSLVYAVKIELPNPDLSLKIGMPADVLLAGVEGVR